MNYNQFTKQQLIQKIINVQPRWKTDLGFLYKSKKEDLLEILDVCLEEKAKEVLND